MRHYSGSVPDWIQLQVWDISSIERYTGNGSIGNPGESANPGMLTVGAAHWRDVRTIESLQQPGTHPGWASKAGRGLERTAGRRR